MRRRCAAIACKREARRCVARPGQILHELWRHDAKRRAQLRVVGEIERPSIGIESLQQPFVASGGDVNL